MQMRQQRIVYRDSGILWLFNCKWHRDGDLPARYYFRDGKLHSIFYCQHGTDHRTTGPAVIYYEAKVKEYYYQDREYYGFEEMLMVEACR